VDSRAGRTGGMLPTTADVIALADQYGRYGYRKIAALLPGESVGQRRKDRAHLETGRSPTNSPNQGAFGALMDRASVCSRSATIKYSTSVRTLMERGARMRTSGPLGLIM
jgi:hypothetical protein